MHFGFTSSDTLILLLYIGCIVKPQCTASQTDSQTDVRHYRVNSLYWSSNNNLTDGSTARTCAWQKQDVGTKHICTSWMTLSHGSQWLAGLGRGLSAGLSSSCRACTFRLHVHVQPAGVLSYSWIFSVNCHEIRDMFLSKQMIPLSGVWHT